LTAMSAFGGKADMMRTRSDVRSKRTFAGVASRSRKLVNEQINGGNPGLPGDDEICSGVSRRLARAARHLTNPQLSITPAGTAADIGSQDE